MGIFDLNEYEQRKKRADESATEPRDFPIVYATVQFDGRVQKLRFEPVLIDGAHLFISFRPDTEPSGKTLIVGKQDQDKGFDKSDVSIEVMHAFEVETEKGFEPQNWLDEACKNIEIGCFGRLKVEATDRRWPIYVFFGAGGVINEEEYAIYTDRTMWRFMAERTAAFDPAPDYEYWASRHDAPSLLSGLDENEFARYLEQEQQRPESFYGLSIHWKDVPVEKKYALLPAIEREIEPQIISLMRAILWSQTHFVVDGSRKGTPLWRRARLWSQLDESLGKTYSLEKQEHARIAAIWPHIVRHFLPFVENAARQEIHPSELHWMNYGGAYLVEFKTPTAHEHLEARLLLRDFLQEKGVSLDAIDAELAQTK